MRLIIYFKDLKSKTSEVLFCVYKKRCLPHPFDLEPVDDQCTFPVWLCNLKQLNCLYKICLILFKHRSRHSLSLKVNLLHSEGITKF